MQDNIAVISLKNIKHNVRIFRSLLPSGVQFFAVVKANAYGHGAERVAESIESDVDGFVVTSVGEGIALRGYVSKRILVLTPPLDEEDVFLATMHGLTLTICNFSSLRIASGCAEKYGLTVRAHLKVNTGMNRLGLHGAPFRRLCASVAECKRIRAEGIYSHLYAPHDLRASERQKQNFLLEREAAERFLGDLTAHLSATGGVLRGTEYAFDGVRIGIGLYGYLPKGFTTCPSDIGLRPAMKLYTHTMQTHTFTGGGVGYGETEKEYGLLTAYRLGYADGLPRRSRAGLRAEGNLCMDSCVSCGKGVYGAKKLVFSDAGKIAGETDTISYETLCAATRRASFLYVE